MTERPPVAAIITEYRPRSHADVIVGKLLDGYLLDGTPTNPRVRIASMYVDQYPEKDMARDLAAKHGVPIFATIREALTLGGDRLAVEGVLLIGEHGDYPNNEIGQKHYPRRRFFLEAAAVMREAGRAVPTFNDKHLSWSWEEAEATWREARELAMPFMAGSSLPVTWRRPPLEVTIGCRIDSAVAVGYGGLESYGFHALETLQCMVERRGDGETGIAAVQCVKGTADAPAELVAAALSHTAISGQDPPDDTRTFVLDYGDGVRAWVLMLPDPVEQFAFAGRVDGELVSTQFYLESREPFGHFAFLVNRFEHMVLTGHPPYPVERTVLTTGALDFLMRSCHRDGERIETPSLAIPYRPR